MVTRSGRAWKLGMFLGTVCFLSLGESSLADPPFGDVPRGNSSRARRTPPNTPTVNVVRGKISRVNPPRPPKDDIVIQNQAISNRNLSNNTACFPNNPFHYGYPYYQGFHPYWGFYAYGNPYWNYPMYPNYGYYYSFPRYSYPRSTPGVGVGVGGWPRGSSFGGGSFPSGPSFGGGNGSFRGGR